MKNIFSKKENRKQQMMQALSTPAIQNNSDQYKQMVAAQNSFNQLQVNNAEETKLIKVTLDQLKPFEGNPRRTKNPAFEDIKASIKLRGLDHAPNITRRPNEDHFTILDGGNTRLQALNELFKETQNPDFWTIDCIYKPWDNSLDDVTQEVNMIIGHLAENDLRGELSFIEKALGIQEVRKLYEKKYNMEFSHRKLAEKLTENGYPIPFSQIARFERTVNFIYPFIPDVLLSGLGKQQIEKLLTLRKNAEDSWTTHSVEVENLKENFSTVWGTVLADFNAEPTEFTVAIFQDALVDAMVEAFDNVVDYETFQFEISMSARQREKLLEKQAEINAQIENTQRNIEASEQQQHQQAKRTQPTITDNKISDSTYTTDIVTDIKDDDNESEEDNFDDLLNIISNEEDDVEDEHNEETECVIAEEDPQITAENFIKKRLEDIGGLSADLEKEAERQGLGFTNNSGRQNVYSIWMVHPKRPTLFIEHLGLALDIAEEFDIEDCINITDKHHFEVLPLDDEKEYPALTQQIHAILSLLETENMDLEISNTIELSTVLINETSDLAMVKLMRLIRLTRHLRNEAKGGSNV